MTKTQDLGGTKLRNAADARKRAFAEHVAAGKSGNEAARLAGFKGTDASLRNTASRLMTKHDVRALIETAIAKASTKRVLTAAERRELLTDWATQASEPADLRDRIAALKELNAMDGLHTKQIQHSGPNGQPIAAMIAALPEEEVRRRLAELERKKA